MDEEQVEDKIIIVNAQVIKDKTLKNVTINQFSKILKLYKVLLQTRQILKKIFG